MRFDRLELAAFGVFSDVTLDFSSDERPFQVVLGANAAGKSTALRAIADLLFGIPERTTDDFLHARTRLRIGATISASDGRTLRFFRRKGRKDTLLDPDDRPIPESALRALLGPVTRELFESMFGLGHERLRHGADDLLQAGGALGESLFESAAGTRSVRVVLQELDDEAGALFRPQASNPRLNAAISRYNEACKRARAESLGSETFRTLENETRALECTIGEQERALEALAVEQTRFERIQRNLPRAAARTRILADLEPLAAVPDLPENAAEERVQALARQQQFRRDIDRSEREIARLEEALDALSIPEEILAEGVRIAELKDELAVVRKGAGDLPKRRAELDARREASRSILTSARAGLTIEAADALRLPRPQEKRLEELAKRHATLATELRAAENAAKEARLQLEAAEEQLARAPAAPDTRVLGDALALARAEGNLDAEEQECSAKLTALRARAAAQLAALPGWTRPGSELESLAAPLPETVRRFADSLGSAAREVERSRERLAERETEIDEIRADIAGLIAGGDVPSAGQLNAARERREQGWRLVRRAYVDGHADVGPEAAAYDRDRTLPEAYEASVTAVDQLADRLREDADRVARHEELRRRERTAAEQIAAASATHETARADHAGVAAQWRALWEPLGIDPLPPDEMSRWLDSRRRIVETVEALREEENRHARILARARKASALLAEALASLGEGAGREDEALGLLVARAQRVVEEGVLLAQRQREAERLAEDRRQTVRRADSRIAEARRRMLDWSEEWRAAVAPIGFSAHTPPVEVEEFQGLLREAFTQIEAARDLEWRIGRIEEDGHRFDAAVAALLARTAPDLGGQSAENALGEIITRHERARSDSVTREEKRKQLDAIRAALEEARRDREAVDLQLDEIRKRAGCSSLQDVERIERDAARRRDLARDLRRLETEILQDGAGRPLGEILADMQDIDGDRVTSTLAADKDRLADLRRKRDEDLKLLGENRQKLDELYRTNAAAADATQDAEAQLAVIRADAGHYVRLRLAGAVLRDFVERYRERHQNPILTRARELFPALTLETFAGIRVEYDEQDRPVVVGVTPDGTTKGIAAMSDGTRDQLYLALRLAAVEQYLAGSEPLPFIADDLLVHFDDDRARATLRTLAEFSRKTQVLFFTHHRHLVELAREVVPGELLNLQILP